MTFWVQESKVANNIPLMAVDLKVAIAGGEVVLGLSFLQSSLRNPKKDPSNWRGEFEPVFCRGLGSQNRHFSGVQDT